MSDGLERIWVTPSLAKQLTEPTRNVMGENTEPYIRDRAANLRRERTMKSQRGIEYDLLTALRRNPTIIQAGDNICSKAADRIEGLEAKLAKVAESLETIVDDLDAYRASFGLVTPTVDVTMQCIAATEAKARVTLAKIKGESDE